MSVASAEPSEISDPQADSAATGAASTPCSSNGDAAASLATLFANSSLQPSASVSLADADGTDKESSSSASSSSAAAAAPAKEAWRLKFLHKVGAVGIPSNQGEGPAAQEAPAELERTPSPSPSVASSDGGGGVEDVVVVRQAPAKQRTTDDIRLGYIKKLENSRAFIPQLNRPKTSQTVTIFDWDDTLLCTSHLEMVQRQFGAIPSQVREQLASIERIVKTLLQHACEVGKTFIITNASEGWVQHSSSLCMPGLADDLAKVEILSARGAFEAQFPGDSHAWKMHAFLQVQNKLQLEAVTNLVSIGDSHIEMDAVHLLGRSFAHALVKTVKLWERPTPYELQKQLEVVADKLPDIYRTGTTLNIWLERETAQAS